MSAFVSGDNGGTWSVANNFTPPASVGEISIDVIGTLDTWGKLDAAEIYVKNFNQDDYTLTVYHARILVEFSTAGPSIPLLQSYYARRRKM
jgi:hypothetical protein